jgi:hypothetical protein
MGKYMYLSFVKWKDKAIKLGAEYFRKNWFPKHEKVCENWGVKVLKWGIPFGTIETHVFVYETDLELSKYQDFRGAVTGIEEDFFDYTRTIICNCPE